MIIRLATVAAMALAVQLLGPTPVLAQGNPANPADSVNNPHPAMPWSSSRRVDYGQVIRYIAVPAQYVVLTVPVRVPDGVPPRSERQVHEVPGYVITETTTGFLYPERWTIQQLNVGGYQWAKVGPAFRRK